MDGTLMDSAASTSNVVYDHQRSSRNSRRTWAPAGLCAPSRSNRGGPSWNSRRPACLAVLIPSRIEVLEISKPFFLRDSAIRIATDVLNGRKRDCVHPLLYHRMTHCGKPGNPKSERSDEIVEFFGRQRAAGSSLLPPIRRRGR